MCCCRRSSIYLNILSKRSLLCEDFFQFNTVFLSSLNHLKIINFSPFFPSFFLSFFPSFLPPLHSSLLALLCLLVWLLAWYFISYLPLRPILLIFPPPSLSLISCCFFHLLSFSFPCLHSILSIVPLSFFLLILFSFPPSSLLLSFLPSLFLFSSHRTLGRSMAFLAITSAGNHCSYRHEGIIFCS